MMNMPTTIPVFQGVDNAGKAITKLLRWGCMIEEDPNRQGYARLAALSKGSPCREGNSYVALGLDNALFPVTVPAGATTGELNYRNSIQEEGYLAHLIVYGVPVTPTLALIEVKRRGDSMVSGNVGCNIFTETSFYNPLWGHWIDTNTQLIVDFRNLGAADINIMPSWALL